MEHIAAAFLKAEVTTLAWLHLLLLDLFKARWSPAQVLVHMRFITCQLPYPVSPEPHAACCASTSNRHQALATECTDSRTCTSVSEHRCKGPCS